MGLREINKEKEKQIEKNEDFLFVYRDEERQRKSRDKR